LKISVDKIIVGDRIRKNIDGEKVKQLAESIHEVGLINPIFVCRDSKEGYFRIIAGLHRLEAIKLNGGTEIEANISAEEVNSLKNELAEIDENLQRSELHYLERGEHLARRKEIYEQLYHQEANEIISSADKFEPKPFTEDAAEKLKVSQRTVQQEMQIATKLIPEMKDIVKDTGAGKVDALNAARLEPELQKKVVDKITAGEAGTVKAAVEALKSEGQGKANENKPQKVETHEEKIINTIDALEVMFDGVNLKQFPREIREAAVITLSKIIERLSGSLD